MILAVTLMVRDEADILPAWIDYHVAQGVDVFVVTDNGSVDGTAEMLAQFAERTDVTVDLRHDPVHKKQQGVVVTRMARDAATLHHADWVVNADADEFLIPVDRSLRLHEVFERLDPKIGAFTVPVVNLTGPLATAGAGIERLHWRDERTTEQLQSIGLLAQPSPNAIHVGDPSVHVVQGNHQVSVANGAPVPDDLAMEVLHLPWRSWRQYEHRVEVSGRAYEANPDLKPSPRHHGMRDYTRLKEGILRALFALRTVTDEAATSGPFTREDGVAEVLRRAGSTALDHVEDELVDPAAAAELVALGRAIETRDQRISALEDDVRAGNDTAEMLRATVVHERTIAQNALHRVTEVESELAAMRARRIVRMADRTTELARRVRRR